MEENTYEFKSIPMNTFFEVFDELSHRDMNSGRKLVIIEDLTISKETNKAVSSNCPNEKTKRQIVPPLSIGPQAAHTQSTWFQSFTGENSRKRPPSELIAIEIPLKPDEVTLESFSSKDSPKFNNEDLRSSSHVSRSSYDSYSIPKIPKSVHSSYSHKPSQDTARLKDYMNKLKEQDSNNLENQSLLSDEETDSVLKTLKETKILELTEIIEAVLNENSNYKKKSEGCFFKCSRKEKANDDNKLEYFYHVLGLNPFDIFKLLHRKILKKYFCCASPDKKFPKALLWNAAGFPSSYESFLERPGSPLALLIGTFVLNSISQDFFNKISKSLTSLLEISLELSIESYKLSKLSKVKKVLSQQNAINNYIKLTSAGIINWFIQKNSKNIENYELTQQVIEKMRDHSSILIECLENNL
jgi:hypothetical protein